MNEAELRNIVDASGFAFQLAVERLVGASESRFKVLAAEHAWTHTRTHNTGFADIILDNNDGIRLVVECKRVRDGHWVFLRPENRLWETASSSRRVEVLWTAVSSDKQATGTDGIFCLPETSQCPFCVVRGSGEGQQPMLERLGGQLLEATEAIANEQHTLDLAHRSTSSPWWLYIPVIVTSAQLSVCAFDPAAVDVANGFLPAKAVFETASAVRFFKNLSFDIDVNLQKDLTATNKAKNRTVFVVNASALPAFLREFKHVEGTPAGMRPFLG